MEEKPTITYQDGIYVLNVKDITGDMAIEDDEAVAVAKYGIEYGVDELNFNGVKYVKVSFYKKIIEYLLKELNK